jgi:hypothetical protein
MKVGRTSKIGSFILHLYISNTSAISFNTNILQIEDAIKLYERNEPFVFLHCWKILKDQQKWNDRVHEASNTMNRNTKASSHCNPMTNEEGHALPLNNAEGRPEG